MITIALDENGDFEGFKGAGNKEPLFIAGIVYDDKGHDNDVWNEKQRLDDYFRAVAETVECKYPDDLHTNKRNTNGYNVKLMKTELQATLPEFFQQCTYKGIPIGKYKRHGQYRIVMMLKSGTGKTILNHKSTSMLVNDEYASNLYMNMAYSTVSRLVFHNPFDLHVSKIKFDLATRLVPVKASDKELCKKYINLGYKDFDFKNSTPEANKNNDTRFFQVANDYNYRAALDRKLLETNRLDLEIEDFSVMNLNLHDMLFSI